MRLALSVKCGPIINKHLKNSAYYDFCPSQAIFGAHLTSLIYNLVDEEVEKKNDILSIYTFFFAMQECREFDQYFYYSVADYIRHRNEHSFDYANKNHTRTSIFLA